MEAAAEAAGAALQDATTALLGLESAAAMGGQDGEAACAFPAAAVVAGAQGLRLLCRAGEQQAEAAQRLVVHRSRHGRIATALAQPRPRVEELHDVLDEYDETHQRIRRLQVDIDGLEAAHRRKRRRQSGGDAADDAAPLRAELEAARQRLRAVAAQRHDIVLSMVGCLVCPWLVG